LRPVSAFLNLFLLSFLSITLCFCGRSAYGADQVKPTVDTLFFELTSPLYLDLVQTKKIQYPFSDDLKLTIKYFQDAKAANNPALAMAIIVGNMTSINLQINRPEIQTITELVLSLHGKLEAETLLQTARSRADNLAEARIAFELAKYNCSQADWAAAQKLLATPSLAEGLTKDDAAEAKLLMGITLQENKRHREAMPYYLSIAATSPHYRLAQLNLATAYIRQDWWTDAQMAINNALAINGAKRDELDYRLYTLLGYSQIQFGFYRDARESFRNVAVGGRYSNRALLGLGMAALHQEDFIGALNAFNYLRSKQEFDISVAESYLLSAFALRRLKQYDSAQSSYEAAIAYYRQLADKFNQSAIVIKSSPPSDSLIETALLRPDARKDKQLRKLSGKLNIVNKLLNESLPELKRNRLNQLKIELDRSYTQRALELLAADQDAIESYLSQSRFGLATLYDGK
jgi:tetratricopeptide (TPR) repeat protein